MTVSFEPGKDLLRKGVLRLTCAAVATCPRSDPISASMIKGIAQSKSSQHHIRHQAPHEVGF